jgi:hypothetical protein
LQLPCRLCHFLRPLSSPPLAARGLVRPSARRSTVRLGTRYPLADTGRWTVLYYLYSPGLPC